MTRKKNWKRVADIAKEFPITLADVKAMKPGEEMPVVVFHRNFCDRHEGKNRTIREAFRLETYTLVKTDDEFAATINMGEGEGFEAIWPYFVEYNPRWWYITEGNEIDIDEMKEEVDEDEIEWGWQPPKYGRYLKDYPPETRVGWRGPFIHPHAIRKYGHYLVYRSIEQD